MVLKHDRDEDWFDRMDGKRVTIQSENDENAELSGYRRNLIKNVFFHATSFLLLGMPYLVGHWYPQWQVRWTMSKSTLPSADVFLVTDEAGDVSVVKVEKVDVSRYQDFPQEYSITFSDDPLEESSRMRLVPNIKPHMRYFTYRRQRYVWSNEAALFERLDGLQDKNKKITKLLRRRDLGITDNVRRNLQELFGNNTIDVEVKSYLVLLLDEAINPFYIFQVGSIILWCSDN